MIDFILNIVLTWYFISAIVFIGLICEYKDNTELSSFLVIVSAILAKFYYQIELKSILILGLVYFICGILTSILRWWSYCINKVKEFNNKDSYFASSLITLNDSIDPSRNMSKICGWVIIWPLALFTFLTEDAVRIIQQFLSKYCIGIFSSISRHAFNKAHVNNSQS